jgi:sulfite exporter TauE/SafE
MSLPLVLSALVLGLAGSPHCVGMCGGLVTASQAGRRRLPMAADGRAARTLRALAQNGGRLFAYGVAGAAAGGAGQLVGRVAADRARWGLEVVAAIALLMAGLTLMGRIPSSPAFGRGVWARLAPVAGRLVGATTLRGAFGFGLVWGFIPCGLVYSALSIAAASASPINGFSVMIAFGMGTAPALVALGTLAGFVAESARRPQFKQWAGAVFVLFGLLQLGFVAREVSRDDRPCCHAAH